MAAKRSAGVTVVAVLLVLGGGLGGCGSLFSAAVGGRPMDPLIAQLNRQLDQLPVGTAEGQVPPDQVTQFREELNGRLGELRRMMDSPAVRLGALANGLLGLAAVFAGFGLMRRAGWASLVVTIQAASSLLVGLWWIFFSPAVSMQQAMQTMVLDVAGGMIPPALEQQMRQTIETSRALSHWVGLAFVVGWNSFLIWYANRTSVKAECQSAGAAQ